MMLESRTVPSVCTDAIRFQNKSFIIRLSYKMNKIIYYPNSETKQADISQLIPHFLGSPASWFRISNRNRAAT